VSDNVPLKVSVVVGVKLTGNRHDRPGKSVPAVEEPALTRGHADAPLLLRVKLVEMLGLLPAAGTEILSAALPMFPTVTVCGLSLLVEPTTVLAKPKLGGSAKSYFSRS
jgi:hypothetical protein